MRTLVIKYNFSEQIRIYISDDLTMTHLQCYTGPETLIIRLINHDAHVNVINSPNNTPLILCLSAGNNFEPINLLYGNESLILYKETRSALFRV